MYAQLAVLFLRAICISAAAATSTLWHA
jgi:hypothetical protein